MTVLSTPAVVGSSQVVGGEGGGRGGSENSTHQHVGNGFLSRLTASNPYMAHGYSPSPQQSSTAVAATTGSSAATLGMPGPYDMPLLVPYQPVPYNAQPPLHHLPVHLENKLFSQQQKHQQTSSRSRSTSPNSRTNSNNNSFRGRASSPRHATPTGTSRLESETLDQAIRVLQHKQSLDIRRLQRN